LNQVIPSFALLEYQLNGFKIGNNSSSELVSSLALLALEFELKKLQKSSAYAVALILDPTLNKRLPGICEKTSWGS
jgi:hypothetical protein